ncbi:transcription termination/antitermination protein NusG [Ligilactobacillus sp. LYQ135]
MADTMEKKWYVLHTYSGYENKVKENLESRAQSMGMENYIFRVVVPEEEKVETTKTGKDKVEKLKTFPGYVLVEMVMTDESWYVVRNTPGVTGFVGSHGSGSKPAPLLDSEIQNILNTLGMSTHANQSKINVGDSVSIISGPFKGQVIKVTEVDDNKIKGNILMMGHETNVEVGFDEVDSIG